MVAKNYIAAAALYVVTPALVFGHPGHGAGSSDGLLHYLTEPFHLVFALVFILTLSVGVRLLFGFRAKAENN